MDIKREQLRFFIGTALLAVALTFFVENLFYLGPIAGLERRFDDTATAYFTPDASQSHPAVAIVAIDEATVTAFPPRSPINRTFLARLLEILQNGNPSAIGVDIFLANPTDYSVDAHLANVLLHSKVPIVLATAMSEGHQVILPPPFNVPEIDTALANLPIDRSDDVLRQFQSAFFDERGNAHLTLAAKLAEIATNSRMERSERLHVIDWYGRPGLHGNDRPPITIFPAHTFLAAPAAAAFLQGKTVLVGATFPASNDFVKTPFSRLMPDGRGVAGVLAHAQITAQLIDRRASIELPYSVRWFLTAVAMAIAVLVAMMRPPTLIAISLAVLLPVLWIVFSLFIRKETSYPLPALQPGAALLVGFGAFSAYQVRRLNRMQRQAMRALAQRVPKDVIDQMIASPNLLHLEGETKSISVLFTDIASFSKFSESVSAGDVMRFLREYLEEVSDVVLSHSGTIDKFIGDAVMAFWGAPLERQDHAVRALACAQELDETGQRIGAAYGLTTRIGVHSGIATVGFLGSRERLEYTAIGDVVNTASRIEGANKYFGTHLCVSGDTVTAAINGGANPSLRRIGAVKLVGRHQPVQIYTSVPAKYDKETLEIYRLAVESLEQKHFKVAENLLRMLPKDDLTAIQLVRCARRNADPINLTGK